MRCTRGKRPTHFLAFDFAIVLQVLDGEHHVAAESDVVGGQSHGRQAARLPRDGKVEDAAGVDGGRFDRYETPAPAARLRVEISQAALPANRINPTENCI